MTITEHIAAVRREMAEAARESGCPMSGSGD